jgi:hypothetical protein
MTKNTRCWWNQKIPHLFQTSLLKPLGMLTEHEEEFGVDNVVQEETNRQRASNVGSRKLWTRFFIHAHKSEGGEVIKTIDNEEEEAINKYVQEEIMMKVEPN